MYVSEPIEEKLIVNDETQPEKKNKSVIVFRIVALVVILLFCAGIVWLFSHPSKIQNMLLWIQHRGIVGNLIIILLFGAIALPFAFTGYTFLCLASGFLYRLLYGSITTFIGANILGVTLGYWVTVLLARPYVEGFIHKRPKLALFLKVVQSHGFKIAFLFRFTPVPYGFQNGVFAVSGLSFSRFWLAALGLVPEQLMWVYFGSTARHLTDIVTNHVSLGKAQIVIICVQVSVCVVLFVAIGFITRRLLKRAIKEQEGEDSSLDLLLAGSQNVAQAVPVNIQDSSKV